MTITFSRREALSFGWGKMKEHLGLFVQLCLLGWLVASFQGALARSGGGPVGLRWLLSAAVQTATTLLAIGWIRAALRAHDGKPVDLASLLPDLGEFFSYLLASALFALIVAVGFALLIAPGLLWAARYGFYGFLIIDRKVDPITALRQSAAMTEGKRGPLIAFGLTLLGVNLLGVLAAGVGLFATLPMTAVAAAYVYRRLAAGAARAGEHGALAVSAHAPA